MSQVAGAALDRAAEVMAGAGGVEAVGRDPIGPELPDTSDLDETGLVAALVGADPVEVGFAMGAATPYEFELAAALQIVVIGGAEDERRARRDAALEAMAAAIAADPTLGGLVDYAELRAPTLSSEERFAGVSAELHLTYCAPTALG